MGQTIKDRSVWDKLDKIRGEHNDLREILIELLNKSEALDDCLDRLYKKLEQMP